MQEFDLHNKFLETAKDIEKKFGSMREDFSKVAEDNIPKIEDKKMRIFLQQSLKDALKGDIKSEDFLNKLKDIQNAD